jgi:predicted nuclease of restriction endonuclease-like RecB superfamily
MVTQLQPIAKTPQYELAISKEKNRAYLKIIGFWRGPEQVAEYISDWNKTIKELSSGFTLLTDATEMKIHPASVRKIHEEAQALIIKRGVKKVAELQADKVAEMQLDGVSKDTRMPKRNFNNREEAEAWLDA